MIVEIWFRKYRVHSYQRLPEPRVDLATYIPGTVDTRPAWSYLATDMAGNKNYCIIVRVPIWKDLISVDDVPLRVVPGVKGYSTEYVVFASGFNTDLLGDKEKSLSVIVRLATVAEEESMVVPQKVGPLANNKPAEILAPPPSVAPPSPPERIEITSPVMDAIRNRLAERDAGMKARPTLTEFFHAYMIEKLPLKAMRSRGWSDRTIRNRRQLAEIVIAEHFGGQVQLGKFRDAIDPRIWRESERELKRARERGRKARLE